MSAGDGDLTGGCGPSCEPLAVAVWDPKQGKKVTSAYAELRAQDGHFGREEWCEQDS